MIWSGDFQSILNRSVVLALKLSGGKGRSANYLAMNTYIIIMQDGYVYFYMIIHFPGTSLQAILDLCYIITIPRPTK